MVTRRAFLEGVGLAGGQTALLTMMTGLGLLATGTSRAQPLPRTGGNGKKVAILGAGIAGLAAAYELGRAGYDTIVLEAAQRAGGRVWTVRSGDTIKQIDRPDQRCIWDDDAGFYFNAGAGRIPQWHHGTVAYLREFGIPLEVAINVNRRAKFDYAGRVISQQQAKSDIRGVIAELLSKAVNRGALNADLTGQDQERLLAFLTKYGDLNRAGTYAGSSRAGYADVPGGYQDPGQHRPPVSLRDMASANFWADAEIFEEHVDQQAPLFQMAGGNDRLVRAFMQRVGRRVRFAARVTRIRKTERGVHIVYSDRRARERIVDADYCICTIPLPVLAKIDADFAAPVRDAIRSASYFPSTKVAFQSRRFWEQEEHQYGGLAWTDEENEAVWYPSARPNADQGIIVGAYSVGWSGPLDRPVTFSNRSHEERIAITLRSVERLHPGRSRELKDPLTVAWSLTPYIEGTAAEWTEAQRASEYALLCRGDGPIYFAGEHMSYYMAWIEGAVLSAHEAIRLIHARVAAHG